MARAEPAFCAAGTPVGQQIAGNCQIVACDGDGGQTSQPDNNNSPASSNPAIRSLLTPNRSVSYCSGIRVDRHPRHHCESRPSAYLVSNHQGGVSPGGNAG